LSWTQFSLLGAKGSEHRPQRERAREQQDIEKVLSDAGSLPLQFFFNEMTGLLIGQGPVLAPVSDAIPKNLELLLNTLREYL